MALASAADRGLNTLSFEKGTLSPVTAARLTRKRIGFWENGASQQEREHDGPPESQQARSAGEAVSLASKARVAGECHDDYKSVEQATRCRAAGTLVSLDFTLFD
jgi:hypothetical protein